MKKILIITFFYLFINTADTREDIISNITVDPYSDDTISLSIHSNPNIDDVTSTIFYRHISENQLGWNILQENHSNTSSPIIFPVSKPGRYQFRVAGFHHKKSDMITLADFDKGKDLFKVGFIGNQYGFKGELSLKKEDPIQGPSYLLFSFQNHLNLFDRWNPTYPLALYFNNKIPLLDWSKYKYLEFNFLPDSHRPYYLYLRTESNNILQWPIEQLMSETSKSSWNSVRLDLDKIFCSSDNRKSIAAFAIMKPLQQIDPLQKYFFMVDAIRLWKSHHIAETIVDITPPSPPQNLNVTILENNVLLTWDKASDKESGIKGYSYYWGTNKSKQPNSPLTIKNQISLPWRTPTYYLTYNLKVHSVNKAGLKSETSVLSIPFNKPK